jgi:hypothetical protein
LYDGVMRTLDPFFFLITTLEGWMNRHQRRIIEYLIEER